MTKFKICGLMDVQHAVVAAEAGADFMGFNFVPGVRRQLSEEQARAIIQKYRRIKGNGGPKLVGLFAEFGVSKARITGGEPLLRTELHQLIRQVAAIDGIEDVTLTTNGYLLAQQAEELKKAGLDRITVSLDSLDDEVFKQMNGRGFGSRRVLHAIQKAWDAGLRPVKINAVVQRACTRLRLSTDGQIFTCLFANKGVSLRDPMREGATDGDIRELITRIWERRTDRYSEERAANTPGVATPRKIEMYQIGG